jgi:hypothetical protein
MPEHRKVRTRGGQVLVPVPALMWRRLRIGDGSTIWWHLSRDGEVILSRSENRKRGPIPPEQVCPHCERREAEVTKLRALLQTGGAVDGRQHFNQGWHDAIGKGLKLETQYQLVRVRLDSIDRQLRELATRRPRPAQRPRGAAQPRTSNPRPDPSLAESSGGAEASGAASPQASHSEVTVQYL